MQEVRVKVFVDGEEKDNKAGRGFLGMLFNEREEKDDGVTISGTTMLVGSLGALDVMSLLDGLDKSLAEEDSSIFIHGLTMFLMKKTKGALKNGD